MQTTRNRGQFLLFEAMAYALGGMFCHTVATGLTLHIIGWAFIAFAVLLIAGSVFNRLIPWGDRINALLSFPLFIVTAAEFIIESVKPQKDIYIILAFIFLLLLILAMFFDIWRVFRRPKHRSG